MVFECSAPVAQGFRPIETVAASQTGSTVAPSLDAALGVQRTTLYQVLGGGWRGEP